MSEPVYISYDPKTPTVTFIYSMGCLFFPSTEKAFQSLVLPHAGQIKYRRLNNRDPIQGPDIFKWAYERKCFAAPSLFVNDKVIQFGAVTPKNKGMFIDNMLAKNSRARQGT